MRLGWDWDPHPKSTAWKFPQIHFIKIKRILFWEGWESEWLTVLASLNHDRAVHIAIWVYEQTGQIILWKQLLLDFHLVKETDHTHLWRHHLSWISQCFIWQLYKLNYVITLLQKDSPRAEIPIETSHWKVKMNRKKFVKQDRNKSETLQKSNCTVSYGKHNWQHLEKNLTEFSNPNFVKYLKSLQKEVIYSTVG